MNPQNRLIESATAHFAKKGFFEATIRDICEEANMNVASVNYHFGSKKDLYKEVLMQAYAKAGSFAPMPLITDYLDDPHVALLEWTKWYTKRLMTSESNTFSQIIALEMNRPSGVLEDIISSNIQPMWDALIDILSAISPNESDRNRTIRGQTIFGSCLVHNMGRHVLGKLKTKEPTSNADYEEIALLITNTNIKAMHCIEGKS